MKQLFILIFVCHTLQMQAQTPDSVYAPNIYSAKLFLAGSQMAYPIMTLNAGTKLELSFDDLDGDAKNYYYTYQLCNADWTPVQISSFDYISGFAQSQITDYRYSSLALIRYTHYHAMLPDNNTRLTASGNYMLKVYLNNDTSKIVFTKRFLVIQTAVTIDAQILIPANPGVSQTEQKLQFTINSKALAISSPFQQLHVVVLQNSRWDNAVYMGNPLFIPGQGSYTTVMIPRYFPAVSNGGGLTCKVFGIRVTVSLRLIT